MVIQCEQENQVAKAAEAECGGASPTHHSPHVKLRNLLAQLIAACSKYLIMLNIGMGISYPTIAIPPILDAVEGLSINQDQASWFASLVFIFQPVGSLASVPLSGLGRKRSMFYLQIPLFIGWLLPFFAESVWELYFASSVMGLGIGFMQAPIATYIGEVTQAKYRGLLACTAYCFLTLGSVCVYAIDVINGNWRNTALYCSFMPPLTAVLLYIIPESPIWLVSKGRYAEAKKALAWLRGWVPETEVEGEFKTILYHNSPQYATIVDSEITSVSAGCELQNIEHRTGSRPGEQGDQTEQGESNKQENWSGGNKSEESFLSYLRRPEMYRPLLLQVVFLYLSNGIGVATCRSYLVLIFRDFHVDIDEYIATVGVTMIGMLGNVLSVILMPIVGKRKLTLTGVVLCAIGCAGIGVYTYFADALNMTWIPIAIMVEIFFATNLGVGHMPWILMSEIFPLRGRTLATGAVAGFGNFLQFLGTKLFLDYVGVLGLSGTFIMYAVTFVLGYVYLHFYLFETEGKTLHEIVSIFRGKNKPK